MTITDNMLEPCFKEVAHNIRQIREQYALTQKQMAQKLDMDTQYYSVLERGDNPQRRFTLEKILVVCKLFDIKPNDIITKLPEAEENEMDTVDILRDIHKSMKVMDTESLCKVKEYMDFIKSQNK